MEYLTMTIREQKNIALIAHDGKKQEMLQWCIANREILKKHHLCGTGTTARMITEQAGLSVKGYNSWPLGGGPAGRCQDRRRTDRHGDLLF